MKSAEKKAIMFLTKAKIFKVTSVLLKKNTQVQYTKATFYI